MHRLMVRESILHRSPAKEAIWIVPFLRLIDVEANLPTISQLEHGYGFLKSLDQRCRAGHTHVGEQPIEQNRDATKASPEIGLLAGFEVPGRHLNEDDVRGLHFGQEAVTDNLCAQRHD